MTTKRLRHTNSEHFAVHTQWRLDGRQLSVHKHWTCEPGDTIMLESFWDKYWGLVCWHVYLVRFDPKEGTHPWTTKENERPSLVKSKPYILGDRWDIHPSTLLLASSLLIPATRRHPVLIVLKIRVSWAYHIHQIRNRSNKWKHKNDAVWDPDRLPGAEAWLNGICQESFLEFTT